MKTQAPLPSIQRAVQLVGPDELRLNAEKPVMTPGPNQILCRVVVVGLCFSDLKLLKQFSGHVRKSAVVSGIDPAVLAEIPSYVPGEKATVPGHEPVVEIVRVGQAVTHFKPGERYFIQADWRWLKTENSNGAFGYNFEGALQEYVLIDERIAISPEGESMLLPAPVGDRSASAFGLVEPWACVEDSYQVEERRHLKAGGRMLVVADGGATTTIDEAFFTNFGRPAEIVRLEGAAVGDGLKNAPDGAFDDVAYFGHDADTLEAIFPKLAKNALINIVLGGGRFSRAVQTPLGAVHYRGVRITGDAGRDAAAGLQRIPATGEIRPGDKIHVVGAGGPMGVMHVVRNLCQGVKGVTVYAADLSDERLAILSKIAAPLAKERGVGYRPYNSKTETLDVAWNYPVIMAPVPALVAAAVDQGAEHAVINIFAGIPADRSGAIDLNAYLVKKQYFIGTSGSVMNDMKIVLAKVESGQLDTNVSVAAVSGLDGAVEGIRAVERQEIPGKIMVYPACRGLGLTRLEELGKHLPAVAAKLVDGVWTREAEEALLAHYAAK